MSDFPDIPGIASLLAHTARARIAWALIDGSHRSAGHLASIANISPQSASRHLVLMLNGGLLEVDTVGRERHYRIVNAEVACMIEGMAALAAEVAGARSPLLDLQRSEPAEFRRARTCYDHFAGRLGCDLLTGMLASGWLQSSKREFHLTPSGESGFASLGVDLVLCRQKRRVFARPCGDITESSPHLGGALGTALLHTCVSREYVVRSRTSRVVTISPAGWQAFRALGIAPKD